MQTNKLNSIKKNILTPLFNIGFRPFFLLAGLYSVLSILIWLLVYSTSLELPLQSIPSYQWHAHEMIYGYCLAVIAGFLLTASKNWTGVQTLHGIPLLLLTLLWFNARVCLFLGHVISASIFDLLFNIILSFAILYPIAKVRQWRQLSIIMLLILFIVGNSMFYLGAFNIFEQGITFGIYCGLYLVIGMILIIARRVIPMFIERGVGYSVSLYNSKWIDLSSTLCFIVFFISELILVNHTFSSYAALMLFFINSFRLLYWHTPGIWKKPMLWSLYLSMWFICFGFLLFFSGHYFWVSKFLAIHAFSYGGIGAITLAMMSRVALGHTGRNISAPPRLISFVFGVMLAGGVVRVILPLFIPSHYLSWIVLSQILWVIAFIAFICIYFPILIRPRIDGKAG